jgi:hypothetical protein
VFHAGDSVGIVSGVIQVILLVPSCLSSGPEPVTLQVADSPESHCRNSVAVPIVRFDRWGENPTIDFDSHSTPITRF